MSIRILLTGCRGQVGQELARRVVGRGHSLLAFDRDRLDITDQAAVGRILAELAPDVVVNAAAYTAVDRAESEPGQAFQVNRDGPALLAAGCDRLGVPLLHLSTDFVFDGNKREPWNEGDPVAPLSVYGRSKAAGEDRVRALLDHHLILRVSWVFGASGHNFVKTILRLATERAELGIVDDQQGCPTWAGHVAEVALTLAERAAAADQVQWGTFHYCDSPPVTWCGFAREIVATAAERMSLPTVRVRPIATEAYPLPAARPANSVLDCARIQRVYGVTGGSWRIGLEKTLDELQAADVDRRQDSRA